MLLQEHGIVMTLGISSWNCMPKTFFPTWEIIFMACLLILALEPGERGKNPAHPRMIKSECFPFPPRALYISFPTERPPEKVRPLPPTLFLFLSHDGSKAQQRGKLWPGQVACTILCAGSIPRSCRRQQSRETPIYNWVLPLLWVFGTSFYPCTSSSRSGVKLDCHWRGETQRRRSLSRAHAFRRAEDQCCTYAAKKQKMLGRKCKKQNMFF